MSYAHVALGYNSGVGPNQHTRTHMPRVIITAEVNDLVGWEQGFRTHGDLFRQMGATNIEFCTGDGNRIAVCIDTSDLAAYMKVLKSTATADAMVADGVRRETVNVFVLDKTFAV